MNLRLLFCLFGTFSFAIASGQYTRHIIQFTDKKGTAFTIANPAAYLSAKAVERRTKQSIAIDSTDLPISKAYIDSIASVPNVTILNKSKWLNQILIRTSDPLAMAKINTFPFVKLTTPVAPRVRPGTSDPVSKTKIFEEELEQHEVTKTQGTTGINVDYGSTGNQIRIHKGEYLHNLGFTGQSMTIAILDAGFFSYKTNPALDSVRIQGRILGEWDYVANHASVNEDNAHGANCFTIIAANRPGAIVGSSPHSKFWLLRTEDAGSEYVVEEQNWAAAAEFADSAGVDMISSSLGYADFDDPSFNHTYPQRDGNTSIVTRAADYAARKGIIVMNSAGNSGTLNNDYKYVGCPADGDSVVAVGAVDVNGNIASFSSWGPNGAGKQKPNIVSVGAGTVYASAAGNPVSGNGTSYSNPNIAGLIACFWQAFPELNNMQLIDAVQRSAHRFNNPDMRYGYGIPNFKTAFLTVLKQMASFNTSLNNCTAIINWESKDNNSMQYKLQRRLTQDTGFITIATINGMASVFEKNSYTYSDTLKNYSGNAQYRVQQVVSTDTTIEVGAGVVNIVNACTSAEGVFVTISPNPATHDVIQLRINTTTAIANLDIVVTDMNGHIVKKLRRSAPLGSTTQQLTLNDVAAGIYIIKFYNGKEEVYTGKIVRQ
ncbi:MAG TPA: S8 family peptidase [Chitinophagaceae bacterium]